ncbi:IS630 family transposase, partial [Hymenobacter elongatus]
MGRPLTPFVLLSADRLTIEALTRKGRHAGRTVQRGRMLLRLADGASGYTVADE